MDYPKKPDCDAFKAMIQVIETNRHGKVTLVGGATLDALLASGDADCVAYGQDILRYKEYIKKQHRKE